MKPISRKIRNIYFYILLGVFIITIPFLVLYSFGYDLDDARSLIETGGVNVSTNMSGVLLHVDGEPEEESSFISRNIFVQKLRLGEHTVLTEKVGYNSWEKTVNIYPNRVTSLQSLMLPIEIPFKKYEESLSPTTIDRIGDVDNIDILNNDYLALSDWFFATTTPSENLNEAMKYSDIVLGDDVKISTTTIVSNNVTFSRQQASPTSTQIIFNDQRIINYFIKNGYEAELIPNIKFIESNDLLIFQEKNNLNIAWLGNEESIPPFFCVDNECLFDKKVARSERINRFAFMPGYSGALIIQTPDGIYGTEIDDRGGINTQNIFEGAGATFKITDSGDIVILHEEVFYVWEV